MSILEQGISFLLWFQGCNILALQTHISARAQSRFWWLGGEVILTLFLKNDDFAVHIRARILSDWLGLLTFFDFVLLSFLMLS